MNNLEYVIETVPVKFVMNQVSNRVCWKLSKVLVTPAVRNMSSRPIQTQMEVYFRGSLD